MPLPMCMRCGGEFLPPYRAPLWRWCRPCSCEGSGVNPWDNPERDWSDWLLDPEPTFYGYVDEDEGRTPDFAVLPDIVGGGYESVKRSHYWRVVLAELFPGFRWAFAVQDGMTPESVYGFTIPGQVSVIFVGGTLEWKLRTMRQWADFAHGRGMECHVGRIGPVDRMVKADLAGADSIDSTTWVQRNGCLRHHVEAYRSFMATRKPLEGFA